MAVLRESPWYQEILKEEAVSLISRLLRRKFGSLSPELQERLQELSLEQLEELSEVLLDLSAIASLETWQGSKSKAASRPHPRILP